MTWAITPGSGRTPRITCRHRTKRVLDIAWGEEPVALRDITLEVDSEKFLVVLASSGYRGGSIDRDNKQEVAT